MRDREREKEKERDRERQRETERDRERQREVIKGFCKKNNQYNIKNRQSSITQKGVTIR